MKRLWTEIEDLEIILNASMSINGSMNLAKLRFNDEGTKIIYLNSLLLTYVLIIWINKRIIPIFVYFRIGLGFELPYDVITTISLKDALTKWEKSLKD